MSGNWKNEKLRGNNAVNNIAQRTLKEEGREIFRVDIELYQHGS